MCGLSEDRLWLCPPDKPSDLICVDSPLPEIMSAFLLCPFEFSEVLDVCWVFYIRSFCTLIFSVNAWNWVLRAGTSLVSKGTLSSLLHPQVEEVCLDPSREKAEFHFALGSLKY